MIMHAPRILIAGIGNIFLGDDAFGIETALALIQRPQPDGVTVREFGARALDVALALEDGYDAVIFIQANARGKTPGTLSRMELELPAPDVNADSTTHGHSLDPVAVLQLAANCGARVGQLFLVGCEPAVRKADECQTELSAPVRAAVPRAVAIVEALVEHLREVNESNRPTPALAAYR